MLNGVFKNGSAQILKEFGEEYIRLAELIILFDKDAWDMIDVAEKKVKVRMLIGSKTAFPDEKSVKIHFMRERVLLITKNIEENIGVRQAQATLSTYMKKHSYEVRSLGLSFKNKTLLTPSEIYANYYYLVQKVPSLVPAEPYNKK